MGYFGWPEAHDNDAERAARAGLAMLDDPPKLAHLYMIQLLTRYRLGRLAEAEASFEAGLKFFDDAGFRKHPGGGAIAAFGT
jgi:hypothetical protein